MMTEDFYNLLKVKTNASYAAVKAAFNRLALTTHPDRNGGNVTAFQQLNRAYKTLSQPIKREQYNQDHMRLTNRKPIDYAIPPPAADIEYDLFVTHKELYTQALCSFTVKRDILCTDCSYLAQADPVYECAFCHGRGYILYSLKNSDNTYNSKDSEVIEDSKDTDNSKDSEYIEYIEYIEYVDICRECLTTGKVINAPTKPCRCFNQGYTTAEQNVQFKLPAGIVPGTSYTVQGAGHEAVGRDTGNLIINIDLNDYLLTGRSFAPDKNNKNNEIDKNDFGKDDVQFEWTPDTFSIYLYVSMEEAMAGEFHRQIPWVDGSRVVLDYVTNNVNDNKQAIQPNTVLYAESGGPYNRDIGVLQDLWVVVFVDISNQPPSVEHIQPFDETARHITLEFADYTRFPKFDLRRL